MPVKRKTISKLAKRKLTGKDGDAKLGSSPLPLKRGKTVEQIYQKKTQVEHILLRPDTYVGSIEKQDDQLWVWNSDKAEMESRGLSLCSCFVQNLRRDSCECCRQFAARQKHERDQRGD